MSRGPDNRHPSLQRCLWWSLTISATKRISTFLCVSNGEKKKKIHAAGLWKVHIRTLGDLCASLLLHKERRKAGEREGEVMKERRGEESSCRGMQRRDWNSLSSSLWHVCWTRVCFLCLHWKKHTQSHMQTHAHFVRLLSCRWWMPLVGSVFSWVFFFFLIPYGFAVMCQSFGSNAFITHGAVRFTTLHILHWK